MVSATPRTPVRSIVNLPTLTTDADEGVQVAYADPSSPNLKERRWPKIALIATMKTSSACT
jgi:hypothetical protein